MKKFISALSSLAIAATAMGTMANAATNDAVSSSAPVILDFQSEGSHEVAVPSGQAATIPVSIYIPQCSGIYDLQLFMQVNDGQPGAGSLKDRNGNDADKAVIEEVTMGNYGITMEEDDWGKQTICLDSGFWSKSKKQAGYYNSGGYSMMIPASFAIGYIGTKAYAENGANMDSYAAWEAAGKPDYADYTPVYAWDKDEEWATTYAFVTFNVKVPAGLADGNYVLDLRREEKYSATASALYDDNNNLLPKDKWGKVKTSIKGVNAAGESVEKDYETVPLTIKVGEGGDVTPGTSTPPTTEPPTSETDPPASSNTQATQATQAPEGDPTDMVYDLVPQGKDYEAISKYGIGNNTYYATPGETLNIEWRVRDDKGTAGIQMHFDFSQLTKAGGKYVGANDDDGCYRVAPTINDADMNDIAYVFAQGVEESPVDDDQIIMFTVEVPTTEGTYTIGLNDSAVNKVVPKDQSKPYSFTFHGLNIVVGNGSGETTAPPATTDPVSSDDGGQQTTASQTQATGAQTTASQSQSTAEPGTKLLGDVNCSGDVKIDDVVLLNRYLAGTKTITPQGEINADCNVDGKVNSDDATEIKEFLARKNLATTKVNTAG